MSVISAGRKGTRTEVAGTRRPDPGDQELRDDIQVYEYNFVGETNWTSHEPYFAYTFFSNFTIQGRWWLYWEVFWQACDENAPPHERNIISDRFGYATELDIQKGGQVVVSLPLQPPTGPAPRNVGSPSMLPTGL